MVVSKAEISFDGMAETFDLLVNKYDLDKRLKIVFDRLADTSLCGRLVLDAGCGTGWFAQRAEAFGARVVALDVGSNLLERARTRCSGPLIVGDVGALPFASATFDVVISSEVIEHTQNPYRTIEEMSRVLKPNGCLLLTVPNRIWKFAVIVANKLKLRPWNGLENWVGWSELKRWMNETGLDVELMLGFHIIPLPMQVTYRFLDWCDRWGDYLGPVMLNIGVRARKKIVK